MLVYLAACGEENPPGAERPEAPDQKQYFAFTSPNYNFFSSIETCFLLRYCKSQNLDPIGLVIINFLLSKWDPFIGDH